MESEAHSIKIDVYKLWVQTTNHIQGEARAWEVTENGNLIVRFKSANPIYATGYFIRIKGGCYGENFYPGMNLRLARTDNDYWVCLNSRYRRYKIN
ncbi:hypothetical protein N9E34_05905 [Opitutales bacterium]|nr:hypothetical protein [Opitutales bacterium]